MPILSSTYSYLHQRICKLDQTNPCYVDSIVVRPTLQKNAAKLDFIITVVLQNLPQETGGSPSIIAHLPVPPRNVMCSRPKATTQVHFWALLSVNTSWPYSQIKEKTIENMVVQAVLIAFKACVSLRCAGLVSTGHLTGRRNRDFDKLVARYAVAAMLARRLSSGAKPSML
ncbi:hypothetical protein GGP41_001552 [Bipolaris sorokiniana]|uniref:Uncharacterized protein n=1 Tax=Cochliobolus sativus TaxID=45130 RepID=A0A8H5ZPL5_COCSA|nr:hypothetical protein GGP41_001552 [Bipolaris sorokiniana]